MEKVNTQERCNRMVQLQRVTLYRQALQCHKGMGHAGAHKVDQAEYAYRLAQKP